MLIIPSPQMTSTFGTFGEKPKDPQRSPQHLNKTLVNISKVSKVLVPRCIGIFGILPISCTGGSPR
jgi:hypothetical protein